MKTVAVAFIWHMHQPPYKDELTGRYALPWVRLHATKGYYDMPALLSKFPKIRQVFNLTPSLLSQMKDYAENPKVQDVFLDLTLKPADQLNDEDKDFILSNFFMNNWTTVVKPHPRYSELLNRRGHGSDTEEIRKAREKFETQDFLDLQVLFNLMWFGYSYRKKEGRLRELIKKGARYTEEEKREVVDFQLRALREVFGLYRKLAASGQAELTTTPFYHPILPLISDRSLGYAYLWEEDARWQVREGIRYFQEMMGVRAAGIWPAEGSVSQDVIPLFAGEGVRWIATDEDILMHSTLAAEGGETPVSERFKREDALYRAYRVQEGDSALSILFRDRKLSDLIGFSYAGADPHACVDDFMRRLRSIRQHLSGSSEPNVITIILDGENAWEHYHYGGERFLSFLYEKLSEEPGFETVLPGEFLSEHAPGSRLSRLYPGSWINHNYQIWYGHHEDRLAWDYLAKTRQFLAAESAAPDVLEKAWREIYAAEASDWFWWYGDEFTSQTQDVFDSLFRSRLMNVYALLKRRHPAYLKRPIKQPHRSRRIHEPAGFLDPLLDGRLTDFYEWINAGKFRTGEADIAMHQSERLISEIYYGFSLTHWFVRIDLEKKLQWESLAGKSGILRVQTRSSAAKAAGEREFEVRFELRDGAGIQVTEFLADERQPGALLEGNLRAASILELSVPFTALDLKPRDELYFTVNIEDTSQLVVEEWPRHGLLGFRTPDETFESLMWNA
ncbi:MAG: hypothetical protein HY714_03915 [Candidatus Omnitrophica bacterium]|nr:hypothetical protein [Candidatus Omnitrophota bacterium]